nr:hypothetical protein [Cellulosimicrobium sp. MM]
MSTSPSAVVTAQVDAFNVRDLDGFCATYAPDAVVSGVTPSRSSAATPCARSTRAGSRTPRCTASSTRP